MLLALGVAVVLITSACGGGGGSGEQAGDGGTTQTTAPTQTEPEKRIDRTDQKRADAMVMRLADFPTGWRGTPKDEKTESADCFKFDMSGVTVSGRAVSDVFSTGSSTTASSAGGVYATVANARKVYEQITSDGLAECLTAYMRKQSDPETTISVTVGELSFPKVGDASIARQFVMEITDKGTSMTLNGYLDLVATRNERAVMFLLFVDVLTPFSPQQEVELARKVAARMAPP